MSTAALDLDSLVVNGRDARKHHADVLAAVTSDSGGVTMTETITGASTVRFTMMDPDRALLRSGLFSGRSTIVLDGAGWELAQVRWLGGTGRLEATFEDLAVAHLRRRKGSRKAEAGTVTRAGFVRNLIRVEEPWIDVYSDSSSRTQVEVARGSGSDADEEDTWTAAGRILGDIGWRVWARRGDIYLGPDSWVIANATSTYRLSEDSDGVDLVDFDWDVGRPAATCTLTVQAAVHSLVPGRHVVNLFDCGPADGLWLVEKTERTAASTRATVTLLRRSPELPEPREESTGDGDDGESGYRSSNTGDGVGRHPAAETEAISSFVAAALSKKGCEYRWGASGPDRFDCSGLVQWSAARAGVTFSKPVTAQWARIQEAGTSMSVESAIGTYGAVLIKISPGRNHVAISLGNGKTIEAMGRAYGVRIGNARGRGWNHAGHVPGLRLARSLGEYLSRR